MVSHPWSHSHKVRVVGDLMVVNSEIEPGKGDRHAYPDGGFRIYDIKDKTAPRLLSFVKTHARGVHRFDLDENFAYISTEMDGFVGNILVIYDIRNPSKPVEVSRWWMRPARTCGGRRAAASRGARPFAPSRHALRQPDVCRLLVFRHLDHRRVGHRASAYARTSQYDPPHAEPTHTFLKVPFPIGGRSIAVSTEEERPKRGPDVGRPHAPLRTWDVTRSDQAEILCTYQLDEDAQP